jgi:hypothetical protein
VEHLVAVLSKSSYNLDCAKKDLPMVQNVARIFKRSRLADKERIFYKTYLLNGGPTDSTGGIQALVADVFGTALAEKNWELSPLTLEEMAARCRKRGDLGGVAADHLLRIKTMEMLLAPAACMFDYLVSCHGQSPAEAAVGAKKQWGKGLKTVDPVKTAHYENDFRNGAEDATAGRCWVELAQALVSGAYEKAIALLLEQNKRTMAARAGSAPWIDVREGKLHVRFQDAIGYLLPGNEELPHYWRHSFFLDSLRTMAYRLRS